MTSACQLLHRLAVPGLTRNERARLCCQLAKELEMSGNYEKAREVMGELWAGVGEEPQLAGLDQSTSAEVLLRAGALTGHLGGDTRFENARELARELMSRSVALFDALGSTRKAAEARAELAVCYWREGAHDEARATLRAASGLLTDEDAETKAVVLYRSAVVEERAGRPHDALRLYLEAAPLFEKTHNDALKGRFYDGFASLLATLAQDENRDDYRDRAFIEFAAAGYYFERAGLQRLQAAVQNSLGSLFCAAGKFSEAHKYIDRAQALFTGLEDSLQLGRVDETRARVLLAEGRPAEAERLARAAAQVSERHGEQSLRAEALRTQGVALARMGEGERAADALRQASEVAERAGDSEAAGLAALTLLEELGGQLGQLELAEAFGRADALLSGSRHPSHRERLLGCARRVLSTMGGPGGPEAWDGFSFDEAVRRFESELLGRALRDAGGVITQAARLLGLKRQSLSSMLHARYRELLTPHPPAGQRGPASRRGERACVRDPAGKSREGDVRDG